MTTYRRGVLQEGRFGWAGRNGLALTEGWFWARRNGGYNLYLGRGSRGAVDFAHPVAASAADAREARLTGLFAADEDYWLAIKTVSRFGLESPDCAWLHLRTDSALAGRPVPDPVRNLRTRRTAAGGVQVMWEYEPRPDAVRPAAFTIYLAANDAPIDYARPAGQVAYRQSGRTYVWTLDVPAPSDPVRISVRARTADGTDDGSRRFVYARTDAAPPGAVTALDVKQS